MVIQSLKNGVSSGRKQSNKFFWSKKSATLDSNANETFGKASAYLLSFNTTPESNSTIYDEPPPSLPEPGYVGFSNIPDQIHRKALKRGFEFSLMVVGQSGLGKSTFINSLLMKEVYTPHEDPEEDPPQTLAVQEKTVRLTERGVKLDLTLVDTPGFGDKVDDTKSWEPIIEYVDKKNEDYFAEETKVDRKNRIPDTKVHCCLYFISPWGHGLKELDVNFMKQLQDKVNIIPVIAKADSLTPEELQKFKIAILEEMTKHQIIFYDFPETEGETDPDANDRQSLLKARAPFGVVGSNQVLDIGGVKKRCRKYPWGIVEIENPEYNDFLALKDLLMRTHMMDMVEVTNCVHYENFRAKQLSIGGGLDSVEKDPITIMEDEKMEHELKMKTEQEKLERLFQQKVGEKERKLKERELEYAQTAEQFSVEVERRRDLLETKKMELMELRVQNPQLASYDSKDRLNSHGSSSDTSPEHREKRWKLGGHHFGKM